MFEDFFENNAPADEEKPGSERRRQIRAAVMERIALDNAESEEKKMKHRFIRPLVIAAAAAAVGTGSLVSANAANNGIVAEKISKVFTVFSSNEAEQPEEWIEADGTSTESGSVVYYTLPDDKADSYDTKTETIQDDWSVVYYYTVPDDKADSSDLKDETIPSDKWSEVYYYLPDETADSSEVKTETIQSGDWSVVYHTVADDNEDVIYDYIFSLENNGVSK